MLRWLAAAGTYALRFVALPAAGGVMVALGLGDVLGSQLLGIGSAIIASTVAYGVLVRVAELGPNMDPVGALAQMVDDLLHRE